MRTSAIAPSPGGVEIATMVSETVIRWNPNCRATAAVAKFSCAGSGSILVCVLRADDFGQRGDQSLVFFHCAHGNADPFGQTIASKRAHDDFSLQQLLEHHATVGDVYHHKIRSGWHERNLH